MQILGSLVQYVWDSWKVPIPAPWQAPRSVKSAFVMQDTPVPVGKITS